MGPLPSASRTIRLASMSTLLPIRPPRLRCGSDPDGSPPASLAGVPVLIVVAALFLDVGSAQGQSRQVTSPDGGVVATVQTGGDRLTYAVRHDGRTIVEPSPISMTVAGRTVLGRDPSVAETSRRSVDLSFLEEGRTYEMTTWADGPNADRFAEDLQTDTQEVTAGDTVTIETAPGGGFAARLEAAE